MDIFRMHWWRKLARIKHSKIEFGSETKGVMKVKLFTECQTLLFSGIS
jgi:hypothetical protein